MVKLTVGDNSGTTRFGPTATVVRASLASIAVGEEVLLRFKDEFNHCTAWRHYVLEKKFFRDAWDESRGRFTGIFRRVGAEVNGEH